MQTNLYYYVKQYRNTFDDDVCQKSLDELNSAKFEKHWYYNNKTQQRFTSDADCYTSAEQLSTSQIIMDNVVGCIDTYQKELDFSWFQEWTAVSAPRFNKYTAGTEMKQHCDHITNLFDGERRGIPILTILGLFQNSDKGGDLILFDDKTVNFQPKDILIFPSIFLFPHRVTPILEGVRYSFVCWAW